MPEEVELKVNGATVSFHQDLPSPSRLRWLEPLVANLSAGR